LDSGIGSADRFSEFIAIGKILMLEQSDCHILASFYRIKVPDAAVGPTAEDFVWTFGTTPPV